MREKWQLLHKESTFLPYTTVTYVTLPWVATAVEKALVTGTGVVRPENRNNIQLENIGVVTMHEN